MIKVGIAGSGFMGNVLADCFNQAPGVEIAGIHSADLDEGEKLWLAACWRAATMQRVKS